MDFIERLTDKINNLELPLKLKIGYLTDAESLVIYSISGSSTVQEYMDGEKEIKLNYEIAMNSKNQERINEVLWGIQDFLERITDIESKDGSFSFNNLRITNKPFINFTDDQGWFVFLLNITVELTIKGDKNGI